MSEPRDIVEPDEAGGGPDQIADEQFVHGLLEFRRNDTPETQRQRVDRVMSSIRGDAGTPRGRASRRAPWPALVTAAAGILVVLGVFVFPEDPKPPSARSVLDAAVDASHSANNRRYEIRVHVLPGSELPALTARLDIRDATHVVLRAEAYHMTVTVGRNAEGTWAVDPHGNVQRSPDGHAWPPRLGFHHGVALLDAVDRLLVLMQQGYELSRVGEETLDEHGDTRFEHLAARRHDPLAAHADDIDVWIHGDSRLVQRMDLRWRRASGMQHAHAHDLVEMLHQALSFLHGDPHQVAQHHETPHRMVFDLVGRPTYSADWFDPSAHSR